MKGNEVDSVQALESRSSSPASDEGRTLDRCKICNAEGDTFCFDCSLMIASGIAELQHRAETAEALVARYEAMLASLCGVQLSLGAVRGATHKLFRNEGGKWVVYDLIRRRFPVRDGKTYKRDDSVLKAYESLSNARNASLTTES